MGNNKDFYSNQGKPWNEEDLNYLINWYAVAGAKEMSYALGRTVKTVENKAFQLRKQGLMRKSEISKKIRV